jgi:hypothetical protein
MPFGNLGVQLLKYDRKQLLTVVDNQQILRQIYIESINMSRALWIRTLTSYFSQISLNHEMKQKHILKYILDQIYYPFYNIK